MNPALVSPPPFRPDHPIARAPEPRFRRGTCDENVYRSVVEHNEYRLPDDMTGAAVVDIGGHIGSFTRACLERGAMRIAVFEPVPANFGVIIGHLRSLSSRDNLIEDVHEFEIEGGADVQGAFVSVLRFAVWNQSSVLFEVPLFPWDESVAELNTGGITLLPVADASATPKVTARSVSIGVVLKMFLSPDYPCIDFLKIDAEGAEWEILSVDTLLWSRVRRICGEYHADPAAGRTPEALRARLETLGFQDIEIIPHAADVTGRLGLFFAGGAQAD